MAKTTAEAAGIEVGSSADLSPVSRAKVCNTNLQYLAMLLGVVLAYSYAVPMLSNMWRFCGDVTDSCLFWGVLHPFPVRLTEMAGSAAARDPGESQGVLQFGILCFGC